MQPHRRASRARHRGSIINPTASRAEAARILDQLPSDLAWLVLFRLSAIRAVVDDVTLRRMFFIPDPIPLDNFSHVILTSAGRYLSAGNDGGTLTHYGGEQSGQSLPRPELSVLDRYVRELERLDLDAADCIGVGRKPDRGAAFLQVILDGGEGDAVALFDRSPSRRHYDLLPAVGVEFLSETTTGDLTEIRFRNRLPTHVKAGALSGFNRTAHCDDFFINHGEIDEKLLGGLVQASEDRTRWARLVCMAVVQKLADAAPSRPLALTCQPPPPQAGFAYGDLVPLGLLLWALEQVPPDASVDAFAAFGRRLTTDLLRRHLDERRQDGLWSFHTGRLVTATDSALVLLGVNDRDAIEALERFSVGPAGYLPQLWGEKNQPHRMQEDPANRHWRQPDFATTCLIRGLRARAGLAETTPTETIAAGFDDRSGLYFANPYLIDLCTAMAIARDPQADALRERLEQEVVASVNPDGSFGQYDRALSTALAILTLGTLGYTGRLIRLAQLRLTEGFESPTWPVSTPFYSTFLLYGEEAALVGSSPQHLTVDGEVHELSLYRDGQRSILCAAAAVALAVPCDATRPDHNLEHRAAAHPRYGCATLEEYLTRFALPPYARAGRPGGA